VRDHFGHDVELIFSQQVLTNFHSNCVVLPMEIKCLVFHLLSKRGKYILLHISILVDNLFLLALFNDYFRGYIALYMRLTVTHEFGRILLYELRG
jgi:hypothetical protein